jgi:hypothetical protein
MEMILGGAVAIGLGVLIINIAISSAMEINSDVTKFRDEAINEKGLWKTVVGFVEEIGINMDFPDVIFSWPKKDQFESEDEYDLAIQNANEVAERADMARQVFGGVLLKYSYFDADGVSYSSRTIGSLPEKEKDIKIALSVKVGSPIKVIYKISEPSTSFLRKTDPETYKEYLSFLIRASYGQAAGGVLVIILGVSGIMYGLSA